MIKKAKLKLPTKNDFSHPELKKCFKIDVIKKINLIDDLQGKASEERYNIFNKLYKFKIDLADFNKIDKVVPILKKAKNSFKTVGIKDFLIKYKHKKGCLVCGNKDVKKNCHILENRFFRKNKKLGKGFKEYNYHPINMVNLCGNCHDRLDHKRFSKETVKPLPKSKLNKIIKNRITLTKRFLNDLDKEINKWKKINKTLDKFNKETESYVRRKYKSLSNSIYRY